RRRDASPVRHPCARAQVAEDGRDVARGVQRDRDRDDDERIAGVEDERPRLERRPEREQRADEQRPAAHVVDERRARVEPRVRLVDQEGGAGDGERERDGEPPELVPQLAADQAKLSRAGEHHHLGPGAVRQHVDGRVREEDHHRPHQHPEREEQRGPQVGPPRAQAPDLAADDRLREQEQPEEQEPGREQPVNVLGGRLHYGPLASSRSRTIVGASSAKTRPAAETSSGGSTTSHQKPWPCGCSRVTRHGCTNAQTTPPSIVSGPSASTVSARADRKRMRESSVAYCVMCCLHLVGLAPKGDDYARSGGGRLSNASPKIRRGGSSSTACGRGVRRAARPARRSARATVACAYSSYSASQPRTAAQTSAQRTASTAKTGSADECSHGESSGQRPAAAPSASAWTRYIAAVTAKKPRQRRGESVTRMRGRAERAPSRRSAARSAACAFRRRQRRRARRSATPLFTSTSR